MFLSSSVQSPVDRTTVPLVPCLSLAYKTDWREDFHGNLGLVIKDR